MKICLLFFEKSDLMSWESHSPCENHHSNLFYSIAVSPDVTATLGARRPAGSALEGQAYAVQQYPVGQLGVCWKRKSVMSWRGILKTVNCREALL